MADHLNNYTVGRGKLFLARETSFDIFDQAGEMYVGNSPGFTLNVESTALDHFSSDGGINELDASVTLSVNRSGSLTLDDISPENMAMFFLGQKIAVVQSAVAVVGEEIDGVLPGLFYQIGITSTNPQGVRGIGSVVVTNDATPTPTTYDVDDDYEIDPVTGRIYVVPGGAILAGTNLRVNYTPVASTRDRIISGSQPVKGRLRYVEDNPAGENRTFLLPWMEISPNGDFDLKGDTWRQMVFNLKPMKRGSMAAIYIDGAPVTA